MPILQMMRKTYRAATSADPHAGAGRRMAPRVPVDVDCAVHWDDSAIEGVLLDVSVGGAAVSLADEAPLSTGSSVTLELPTVLSVLSVPATVVSQDEEAFGSFVLRVKFEDAGPELRALVEQRAAAFREQQAAIFLGRV